MSTDPRYYAAMQHTMVLFGGARQTSLYPGDPVPTYDAAIQQHAGRLARGEMVTADHQRPVILVDLASVGEALTDAAAMRRLLATDPVLRAIYELGRQGAPMSSPPPETREQWETRVDLARFAAGVSGSPTGDGEQR